MTRLRSESGAVAPLLAIVLTLALMFATAAGLSTLTRAGTRGELQRSADAGALAGARVIAVGDLSAAVNYINNAGGVLAWPGADDPLAEACAQAARSAGEDDAISEEYAETVAHCVAEYTHDLDAIDRVIQCADSLLGSGAPAVPLAPTPPPIPIIDPITGLVTGYIEQTLPEVDPILASLPSVTDLLHSHLSQLVPALLRPGIKVELTRTLPDGGPIDGVAPQEVNNTEHVTAIAQRRFKNLIVVPVIDVLQPLLGQSVDLNPTLADTHAEVVAMLDALDAAYQDALNALAGTLGWDLKCRKVFEALKDDFNDLYNPGTGNPPTVGEVITDLQATGEETMALLIGWDPAAGGPLPLPNDPTGALGIPFFEFVPVCLSGNTVLLDQAACATNATGAFRASLVKGGARP